jgi:hypothetical protein
MKTHVNGQEGDRRTVLMNQKIFTMELSVEATSAYIVICSLAEGGAPVTIESVSAFWNAAPEALTAALRELGNHRIITEALDDKLMRQYLLNPPDRWRRPAP